MTSHRTIVLSLLAPLLFAGIAVAQNPNTPVPECGNPQIENDTLFIVNPCGFAVNVAFTSLGEVWGGMPIGPGQRAQTGYSGEAVNRVGGVHVYTCRGYGSPAQPDGSPIIAGYTGRLYACHGSTESQNQPQPDLQPSQLAQQQGQQARISPVSNNPWNRVVTTPTPSDTAVEQSDNTQQASDDDDDTDNTDTDEDTDQTTSVLQQSLQVMQNVVGMIQSNPRIQAQPTRSGSGVPQSQCVGERCY